MRRRSLGKAFPDQVIKARHSSKLHGGSFHGTGWEDVLVPHYQTPRGEENTISLWKITLIAVIAIFAFTGLFTRMFHLQVVNGQDNRDLADSNRVRIRVIHAPRGVIYDRNGKVLAQNDPGFRMVEKNDTGETKTTFLSRDQALTMEVKNDPKFNELEVDTIRAYPQGPSVAHILGYVGELNGDELKDVAYSDYKLGDRIGRSGVEQVYERVLRGTDGAEIIEVDAQGKKLQSLRTIDPIPGQNLYLSIDADLQRQAFLALQEGVQKVGACCGTVIGQDPKNGQILTLVSFPSFDANAFNDPKRSSEVSGYFTDPNAPLLNRAIAGTYPPGSTFKISSALAGLSSGKITKDTKYEDTGIMHLGPYSFANWYFTEYGKKEEGGVDVIKALQRSNDIYFYQIGHTIGEEIIGKVAQQIGMGKKLGIDLPGEVDGLIPDDAWKQKHIGEAWYPGDTLHMSIGQGFVLTTPLQVLAETAFIADNGQLFQPHLALKVTQPDGSLVKEFNYQPIAKNVFKPEDIETIKQGLSLVPKQGGTAWPFFNFSVQTAGKTGTAEFGDPKNKTHAWYTSYGPEQDPSIVLTVLVEAGGEGSNAAAPIAKQIYTWYFSPDKTHIQSLDVAPLATQSAKTFGE